MPLRWVIVCLLLAATTINYIDRQALSVAAPVLRDEFNLSNSQYGTITATFLAAYALGQLVGGRIIDRLGTRLAFSLAVLLWSAAAMGHALARGFTSLLVARAGLGLFESANYPAATKAVAEWMPKAERGMAVAVITIGPGLGAILAPPVVGALILYSGWQSAFLVTGALGLIWLFIWRRLYHPPERHPRLSDAERRQLLGERLTGPGDRPIPTRDLLLRRDMLGLILARFVADGSFYFYVFWLPLYLADEQGFNVGDIAVFAWLPFVAADLGSLAAGWLSERLVRRGVSINAARKGLIWIGAVCAVVGLYAVVAGQAW